MRRTIDDLFNTAQHTFGFDEKTTRAIMKKYGENEFKSSEWTKYVGYLHRENFERQAYIKYPEQCPMCGSPVERDNSRDRSFGVIWGWKCTKNHEHFLQARIDLLRLKVEANRNKNTVVQLELI